jgi:phosphohistidine phosphatase
MRVYLIQHGEAKSKEEDEKRPLSEKGRLDVEKTGRFLKIVGIKVSSIIHSGKLRAMQTAEIIGNHLGIKPIQKDGLLPKDDPYPWVNRVKDMHEDIMIVGHLPYLSKFASLLILGDAEKTIIAFKMAGVVCIRKVDDDWRVSWMVTPELLQRI